MKRKVLTIVIALMITNAIQAQWVEFTDESDTRIVVTNINDNANSGVQDDMEKDLLIGDFNNDSFTDLIVVRKVPFSTPGGKTDLLFINDNGVLVDMTDVYAPEFLSDNTDSRDVISVDADGDGWLDLFVVNTFQDQPKLFMNQGEDSNGDWLGFVDESATRLPTVTVSIIQYCAGWSGDLTGNGAPDLYMVNYDPSGLALDVLFINDGNGNFTEETDARMGDLRNSSFGTGVEFHDVDNDNDLDIVKNIGLGAVAPFNVQGTLALFNNGDGTFTNWFKLPGPTTYMFTAGDLNDDGMLDFYEVDDGQDYVNFITDMQPDLDLTIDQQFLNSDRTDVWGGNVKMVDIDGDGDLDVTVASVDTDEPPCDTSVDIGQAGGVRIFAMFENEGLFSGNLIDPYDGNDQDWHISNYDQDFIDINNDGLMDMIIGACEDYKIFVQNPPLSVNDESINQLISVSPNPSDGRINIHLDATSISSLTIDVYNVTGKLVETFSEETLLSNSIKIDARNSTSSGIYFLKMTTEKGITTQKIIIE